MAMVLINSGLGIYSYMEEKKNPLNTSFAIWIFSSSFWYISFFLETLPLNRAILAALFRISSIGIAFIPAAFINFIFVFSGRRINRTGRYFIFLPPAIFTLLLLSDFTSLKLWISTLKTSIWGIEPVFIAPTYLLFVIYFVIYTAYGGIELLRHFRNTLVSIRKQFEYAIVTLSIFLFVVGILMDIILPIFGIFIPFRLTSLGILIVAVSLTYAITQYNERRREKRIGLRSRARIFLSFLVVISITPLVTLIGIWRLSNINEELRSFAEFSLEVSSQSSKIGTDLIRLYQTERMLLSPEIDAEKEALSEKLRVYKAGLVESKENLKILMLIEEGKSIQGIDERYQRWIDTHDRVVELLNLGKTEEAQRLSINQGESSFSDLQTEVSRVVSENGVDLQERKDRLTTGFSRALAFTITASALGFFISLLVALAISTGFFRKLREGVDYDEEKDMTKVEGTNELENKDSV